MKIYINFKIMDNTQGSKNYYCWNGSVLHVAIVDEWQDIIFGCFNGLWALGVKRNDIKKGRSSKYYQVISAPLVQPILEYILNLAGKPSHRKIMEIVMESIDTSCKENPILSEIKKYLTKN